MSYVNDAVYLDATDRYDIHALIKVREALEDGAQEVHVVFANGATTMFYTPLDLPAIRRKLIYNV